MTNQHTLKFLRGRDTPATTDFAVGDRVQLHPATDLWMRGARWGTVAGIGRKLVRVHVDALGRTINISPAHLMHVA
jgi:hypothetical protein